MTRTIFTGRELTESTRYWLDDRPAAFRRSRERWGEFSNMTGGYPITACGVRFQSSEGLYQALKFPHCPERQLAIAKAHNGYQAKLVAYQDGPKPHPKWDDHRIDAMRIALAFKLDRYPRITAALLSTGQRDIIESSSRDTFWGARPHSRGYTGCNVLGKLLMEFRQFLRDCPDSSPFQYVEVAFRHRFVINGREITPDPITTSHSHKEAPLC